MASIDPPMAGPAFPLSLRRALALIVGLLALILLLFLLFGANLSGLFLLLLAVLALLAAWQLWQMPRPRLSLAQRLATDAAFLDDLPAATDADRAALPTDSDGELGQLLGGRLVAGQIAGHYEILYQDARGSQATRRIAVYAIVERSDAINIDCFSADQISCRTYRADRILRLTDLATGEVVTRDLVGWLLRQAG